MGKEIQELRLKLRKSQEGVEVRALQNNEESKGIYRDVSSLRARSDQQVRELEDLRAKLVKETEAKQEAASRANRLQKTINEQADALREAGVEKAELLTTVDNQTAELAKYKRQQTGLQAEADIGLVKEAMKGERARLGEEDKRREDRVQGALGNLGEGEEGRRQRLMNELETKDAELYEANRQVRELGRKLLASNQATAAALAAVSASKSSQSSLSSPSPTSISTPPSSSTPSTAMPWLQLSLSPRRFLILLFIFLLSFAIPIFHFNSLSQQAAEERKMRQTEVVRPRDQRIIQEARTLAMWEQNDPVMTEEEGWRRTLEAARRNNEGF